MGENGFYRRADQNSNWRPGNKTTESVCRYCKQSGHLINVCPTRPPRGQQRNRRNFQPVKRPTPPASPEPLPSDMYWPALIPNKDSGDNIPKLHHIWATGPLSDESSDSDSEN